MRKIIMVKGVVFVLKNRINTDIVFKKDDGIFSFDEVKLFTTPQYASRFDFKGELLSSEGTVYSLYNNKVEELFYSKDLIEKIIDDQFIIQFGNGKKFLFDIKENKNKWVIDHIGFIDVISEMNFGYKDLLKANFYHLHNLKNGEKIWSVDVNRFDIGKSKSMNLQITSTAILTQKRVCVCVCNEKLESYIIGLNLGDGKLVWQVEAGYFEVYQNYAYSFYLDYQKSVRLLKIDTETGNKEEFDLSEEYVKNNLPLDVGGFTISDNYLYMSLYGTGYVIIFNLHTMQIENVIQIPITKDAWQIDTPQVSGNRLYVRDQSNTLHIFEHDK